MDSSRDSETTIASSSGIASSRASSVLSNFLVQPTISHIFNHQRSYESKHVAYKSNSSYNILLFIFKEVAKKMFQLLRH